MTKVLYWNNCWFTNVGEAFIDIGAMELIKRIFGDAKITNISAMNHYYVKTNPFFLEGGGIRLLDMADYYTADYIVLAGMFAALEFIDASRTIHVLRKLVSRGIKLIFLGLGQCEYSQIETERFRGVIEELKPVLISSRDDVVYENFRDSVNCVRALDCAFWVKDVYDPRGAADDSYKYEVVSFNRSRTPSDLKTQYDVIKCWHFQHSLGKNNLTDNMLVSDTPYDYLTVYANAERVTTDLVHGTIASLQYGRPVRFLRTDKRGYAIDAVKKMKMDVNGYCFVEENDLEEQKKQAENDIKIALKL